MCADSSVRDVCNWGQRCRNEPSREAVQPGSLSSANDSYKHINLVRSFFEVLFTFPSVNALNWIVHILMSYYTS